jgi:hypothetical protein
MNAMCEQIRRSSKIRNRFRWLCGVVIFSLVWIRALCASAGQQPIIDERASASAGGYEGTLQAVSLAREAVSIPPDTVVSAWRLFSVDGDFPEIELILVEGQVWDAHLNGMKQAVRAAQDWQDRFPKSEMMGPLSLPRLVAVGEEREGVVMDLPGMAGTGLQAIIPRPGGVRFLLVLTTAQDMDRVLRAAPDEPFSRRLAGDPLGMLAAVARAADAALQDSA